MREHYDVVVVGSGFGGAVAAARLAQAGLRVVVLERGRRFPLGGFPRTVGEPWLWELGQGPFDVRLLGEATVVTAAAFGGGSQLYSNVHLRLPADRFDDGWPAGWSREVLDPYYDLVAHMLEIVPIDESQPKGVPPRTRRMEEAAARLGRSGQYFRPPLAVRFTEPDVPVTNRYGREQFGCTHCGECSIGCNTRSKNTLDLTYLALAEDLGAEMVVRHEVTGLTPVDDDGGYELTCTDHTDGAEVRVRAARVVLAAGTLGTTELLQRARHDDEQRWAGLSPRLGERYSANGDMLAFALGTREDWGPGSGPAITAGILHAEGEAADPWFLVQDGGIPPLVARVAVRALRGVDLAEDSQASLFPVRWRTRLDDLSTAGQGDPAHTAVLLAMGRDSSDGVLTRTGIPVWPTWLRWPLRRNRPLYRAERTLTEEITRELGGDPVTDPAWRYLRLPISVHSLGGAVMADDPDHGVVDTHGEVFGHPGLYVFDGAALPAATGVNPSHTIAATAERNVEHLVREILADPGWRAPERAEATPVHDTLPPVPPGGTVPVRDRRRGLRSSRLRARGVLARTGDGAPLPVTIEATDAVTPHWRRLRHGRHRRVTLTGSVRIGDGPERELASAVVRIGRRSHWMLTTEGPDGPTSIQGWSTGSTLRMSWHVGPDPGAAPVAVGTLRIDVVGFLARLRLTERSTT